MRASFTFAMVTNKVLNDSLLNDLVQNIHTSCVAKDMVVIFHDQSTEIEGDFEEINKIFSEEIAKQSKNNDVKNYDIKLKIKFL